MINQLRTNDFFFIYNCLDLNLYSSFNCATHELQEGQDDEGQDDLISEFIFIIEYDVSTVIKIIPTMIYSCLDLDINANLIKVSQA